MPARLSIPTHQELDSGPFIGAGLIGGFINPETSKTEL